MFLVFCMIYDTVNRVSCFPLFTSNYTYFLQHFAVLWKGISSKHKRLKCWYFLIHSVDTMPRQFFKFSRFSHMLNCIDCLDKIVIYRVKTKILHLIISFNIVNLATYMSPQTWLWCEEMELQSPTGYLSAGGGREMTFPGISLYPALLVYILNEMLR